MSSARTFESRRHSRTAWAYARRRFAKASWGFGIPLAVLLGVIVLGVAAPVVSPHDRYAFVGGSFEQPNAAFPFGTDRLGRDVLSRVIWGTRLSLVVATASVALGVGIGGAWGIASGYRGGRFDLFSQRIVDVISAFPSIVLALAFMSILGQSASNVVVALAVVFVPTTARTLRSVAMEVKNAAYVEVAFSIGSSDTRIIRTHVLPNCLPTLVVLASASISVAIVAEASLSFLGVGAPRDEASWGGMISDGAAPYLTFAPWVAFAPGILLSLTVLSLNFLGDAIQDRLDPRLRQRAASSEGI